MTRKVHFMCRNWGQSQDMGLGALSPCWTRTLSYSKTGWLKRLTTNDTDKVTCKHCIVALAKVVERALNPTCRHWDEAGRSTVIVAINGAACTQCGARGKYASAIS